MSITPAPLWEAATSAVAHAADRDPRPLDAELTQLEVFAESLPVGCVRLAATFI